MAITEISIHNLTTDLLGNIFDQMTDSDKKICKLVCRKWNEVILSSAIKQANVLDETEQPNKKIKLSKSEETPPLDTVAQHDPNQMQQESFATSLVKTTTDPLLRTVKTLQFKHNVPRMFNPSPGKIHLKPQNGVPQNLSFSTRDGRSYYSGYLNAIQNQRQNQENPNIREDNVISATVHLQPPAQPPVNQNINNNNAMQVDEIPSSPNREEDFEIDLNPSPPSSSKSEDEDLPYKASNSDAESDTSSENL